MSTTLEKYLPLIHKHFPDVTEKEITFFSNGHDHYVFLVDNTAFRIPRSAEHGKKDSVENIFLPEFAAISPLPIQAFTSHIDEELGITYQTYTFISGKGFTKEIANRFSSEEKVTIAKKLGLFLKTLHSYPVEKAHEIHMDELDPKGYYEFFENIWIENKKTIYPLLSGIEQQWCDELFGSYLDTKTDAFIPLVTHNDMLPEHIIIDEQSHSLSGIIDFALRIADPARDFMFFHVYGNDFLETAIRAYGEIDKTFLKRRKFYGGNFYIMYLYNAVTRGDSDVEKHKAALTNYIEEYKPA